MATKVLTLTTCQWINRINKQIIDLNNKVDNIITEEGNSTFAGEGVPSNSMGKPGDIYIELDAGLVYSKGATTWNIIGAISINGGTF